jgi:plasmid stabilization system protein ParE
VEYNLIFSHRAEQRIEQLLDYLFQNWGLKVQEAFISKLEHCLFIIKQNPYSFAYCDISGMRKCVITPLNILYYTIQENDILVISIEDTRMNPQSFFLI